MIIGIIKDASTAEILLNNLHGVDIDDQAVEVTKLSLLLKVRVGDMPALQTLLLEQLSSQEGVRQTRTVMVLSTVKEETYVEPENTGGEE